MGKTLTLRRSTSLESLSSAESLPSCIGTVISDNADQKVLLRRERIRSKTNAKNEYKRKNKEQLGSLLLGVATFLIFAWAIRSLQPYQYTESTSLRNHDISYSKMATYDMPQVSSSTSTLRHRRLTHMEFAHKMAPSDLKKMHRLNDPRTTTQREGTPLSSNEYKVNALVRPDGYPWHRWSKPTDGTYPLNTQKYVKIFERLGKGEDELGTVTPNNYTVGGVKLTPDTIRLGNKVRPYIIKDGTVLRPGGRTGMFVTLVQRAVEMAVSLSEKSPRMKLLSEGEIPLIFDANDYPWCGDDYVPIFRLNAIQSMNCRHSWPAMSLTYFQDPTNVQLAESPYQWDTMMEEWDKNYPWKTKISKVVWRGRITGYTYKDGERPRQNLVRYSRDYLDIMDIKPSTKKSLIKQDDFQKYKAILDIDGNAWSARLGKLLCFNSVVIKVQPEYVGYWEKELEPWVVSLNRRSVELSVLSMYHIHLT